MAGAFDLRRDHELAGVRPSIGAFAPPEGVPDLGFGPMTPDTIAGRPAGSISLPGPSDFETALGYGSAPAKMYADAFGGATDAVAGAMADPSIRNVGNAAIRTALVAAPSAKVIGGTTAGAFGAAGIDDILRATGGIIPSASAEESDMIRSLRENARAAREEAGKDVKGKGKAEADRIRLQRAEAARVAEQAYTSALAAEEARTSKLAEIEATTAAERKATQEAVEARRYNDAVTGAQDARARVLAKAAPEFKDTTVGQLYQDAGGLQNMAAGFVPGFMRGLAGKAAGSNPLMSIAEGAFAGGTMANVPDLYNASMADTLNPERRSLTEYMYNLPDGHPDIVKTRKRIEDSATMPYLNPVRTEAQNTLVSPMKLLGRTFWGAGEGAVGAATGLVTPPAARGAAQLIGDLSYEAGKIPKALAQGFKEDYRPAPAPASPPPSGPASAFARAEPEVLAPAPQLTERFQFGQPALNAPSQTPMAFDLKPPQWPPTFNAQSRGELVPAASRSVAPTSAPAKMEASTPPAAPVDLSKTKARTRTWEKAFKRAEDAKTKDEAIAAIRDLKPDTGFDPRKAGVAKRRMIKTLEGSTGKHGKDWRAALEALRDDLKSKGLYGVSAAAIGAHTVTQKPENN